MTMSLERRQQIALKVLQHKVRRDGIPTLDRMKIMDMVIEGKQAVNISYEEAEEFYRLLVQEAIDEAFRGDNDEEEVSQEDSET